MFNYWEVNKEADCLLMEKNSLHLFRKHWNSNIAKLSHLIQSLPFLWLHYNNDKVLSMSSYVADTWNIAQFALFTLLMFSGIACG